MYLHDIKAPKGSKTRRDRIGRGNGSGAGKTAGRGENGQKSRSGRGIIKGLEGGQMPLIRRIPKVGFTSLNPIVYQVVQLERLEDFEVGTEVTAQLLKDASLISTVRKPYKILSKGELTKSLEVSAHAFSTVAKAKIEKAGGKAIVIGSEKIADESKGKKA